MTQSLFRADLHCHSTCSDGTLSPEKLIYLAKELGLSGLSITDHDTISAYDTSLLDLANDLNIYLLPGVEVSSKFQDNSLHILAYGRKLVCDSFKQFLCQIQLQREDRNRKILQKLTERNMPITEDELKEFAMTNFPFEQKSIGRPHIALLMIKKKYVTSLQEAFDRYIKDGAPCYEKGERYTPEEVIKNIHQANGLAVVAHPHFFKKQAFIDELFSLPFDGVECYYSKLDLAFEQKWIDLANKKNLIKTGGSDFHGTLKPHISLGCSWVDQETFFHLYNHG